MTKEVDDIEDQEIDFPTMDDGMKQVKVAEARRIMKRNDHSSYGLFDLPVITATDGKKYKAPLIAVDILHDHVQKADKQEDAVRDPDIENAPRQLGKHDTITAAAARKALRKNPQAWYSSVNIDVTTDSGKEITVYRGSLRKIIAEADAELAKKAESAQQLTAQGGVEDKEARESRSGAVKSVQPTGVEDETAMMSRSATDADTPVAAASAATAVASAAPAKATRHRTTPRTQHFNDVVSPSHRNWGAPASTASVATLDGASEGQQLGGSKDDLIRQLQSLLVVMDKAERTATRVWGHEGTDTRVASTERQPRTPNV